MRATLATCILLLIFTVRADAAPERAGMSASEIAEALLSRDPAQIDRGLTELQSASGATCEALGKEVLGRGVREAECILGAVALSQSPNALIAAFVALESDDGEVRNAAVDALLAVPFTVSAKCGDEFLKGKRRERLREILTNSVELGARCDANRRKPDGSINDDPRVALNLSMLGDRFFGAQGFTGPLRGLAKVMLGNDIVLPPDIPPLAKRKPGESDGAYAAREAAHKAAQADRAAKMEIFSIELSRRESAQAMFRAIWIADLTQFNYVVESNYQARELAVQRINKCLDAMDAREVELDDKRFPGVRSGDYLMELWSSDVADVKAAAYLRMKAMAGEKVALHGEEYANAVSELNALNRRQLAELRKNLKAWWSQYRANTEAK